MSAPRVDRTSGCDPEYIRLLDRASSRSREIERFYARLRARHMPDLDRSFREAHERAFAEIDCRRCAACCRSPGPRIAPADARRLARHLGLRESVFAPRYLVVDEDEDTVFRTLPCPFLGGDNLCAVYDARPKACREYPHTDQRNMRGLLRITARNALLCPAVYLVTEGLMQELGA